MTQTKITLNISESCVFQLEPLRISEEDGRFLFGVPQSGRYFCTSAVGARAIHLLGTGLAIGEVRKHLQEEFGKPDLDLRPLLNSLFAGGGVRAVDALEIHRHKSFHSGIAISISKRSITCLFSPGAIVTYALAVGVALILLLSMQWFPVSLALLLTEMSYAHVSILAIAIGLVNAAKHELAHACAAVYLGITPRFSVGYRLFCPVLQTDLTDMWTIERRKRPVAFLAGVMSDVLALAVVTILGTFVTHFGGYREMLVTGRLNQILSLSFIVILLQVLWQLNIALRTDFYYLLAGAMDCHNLHADAKLYLRSLAARILTLRIANCALKTTPRRIRAYSLIVASVYGILIVMFLRNAIEIARTSLASLRAITLGHLPHIDAGQSIATLAAFVFSLLVVAWAKYREARGERIVYQINYGAQEE